MLRNVESSAVDKRMYHVLFGDVEDVDCVLLVKQYLVRVNVSIEERKKIRRSQAHGYRSMVLKVSGSASGTSTSVGLSKLPMNIALKTSDAAHRIATMAGMRST